MRKIRELGSLPSDAFEKYQNLTLKQVNIHYIAIYISITSENLKYITSRL